MTLPLAPPLQPQLALSRKTLPEGEVYVYEIKLDGFRCIAFVDGEEVFLQSRNGRPLGRYFPELRLPAGRYVLDGEIVVRGSEGGAAGRRSAGQNGDRSGRHSLRSRPRIGQRRRRVSTGFGRAPLHCWSGREDFDALGQRIHPAASRIELLARETPAVYVAFDLLAREDESLLEQPLSERRAALEALLGESRFAGAPVELMPTVATVGEAERWLREAEGAIAKERAAPYRPGERRGMFKVKRVRTIDAVVTGWRPGKEPGTVGALILALYDGGELRVVGHCSGLTAAEKRRLVGFLAPYETGERGTADPSRWSAGRNLEWVALRPELVVEIDFDHVSAGRIRHGAKLRRWREDKDPRQCTFDQLR
ncbi:MAG TPA: ATP-dependent DNA ligase [Solirubrobacteraceae bacterium]|nr:ATP-dependent DNA ligase [Solirubrobacteraceae bacterium]